MTSSAAPQGEDAGLEQEGIWEDASGTKDPDLPHGLPADAADTGGLTQNLTSTAHTPGPAGLLYADVPNRIMALIIDIIVLSVIGFVLAWAFGGLVSEPGAIDATRGELDIAAFLIVLVLQLGVSFAYFGGSWTLAKATLGMRMLGLRIGDETDGRAIVWRQSLVRWLLLGIPSLLVSLAVYVPNTIGVILSALGVAWLLLLLYTMAQSPTKQGLHDRYAHTILVRSRRRRPA